MFKPYCPQCGEVKPDNITAATCGPCAKKGHIYRLVENEEDRLWRIEMRQKFYKEHGFTNKELAAIPSYQNLLIVPEDAKKP